MKLDFKRITGFTLIEFMLVIVIIMMMIGFTLPSYYNYKTKELQKDQEVHRESIERAIKQCLALEGSLYQEVDPINPAIEITTGSACLAYYVDNYHISLNDSLYNYGFDVLGADNTTYNLTVQLKELIGR